MSSSHVSPESHNICYKQSAKVGSVIDGAGTHESNVSVKAMGQGRFP